VGDISNMSYIKDYIITQVELEEKNNNYEPCKGRLVCSCFRVKEINIMEYLKNVKTHNVDDIYNSLTKDLKAGTGCGSCKIEIRKMIENHHQLKELKAV